MEDRELQDLSDCLICCNDIEALECYLCGNERGDDPDEFMNSIRDRSIHIVENILPLYYTPLEESVIGHIMIKDDETIEQINQRKIKFVLIDEDNELDNDYDQGWSMIDVTIPKGSLCYCHISPETKVVCIFTNAKLKLV